MLPTLTVILPAYNEEQRLGETLDRMLEHPRLRAGCEILVVDDGSTDATVELAEERLAAHPLGHVLQHPSNKGKGAALRTGAFAASGHKILFMDADLATSLDALGPMIDRLDTCHIVVGSRRMHGATVSGRSRSRAVMHRAFNAPARQITGLAVSDPQCGFKGFRGDIAKMLFRRSLVNGYTIDVELLLIAQRLGLRIEEIPVAWRAVGGSKIRVLRDPLTMAAEIARVRYRHRGLMELPEATAA